MKRVILFFFFLSLLVVYSQTQYIDVVYLKNGGKISGIIVEQIPGESIKIETKDGGLLIFKMDEIEKMTKEKVAGETEAPPPPPVKETPPPPPPQETTPAAATSQPMTTPQTQTSPPTEEKFQHSGTQLTILGGFVSWKQTKRTIEVDGKETDLTKDNAGGSKFVMTATATFQSDNFAFVFGGVVNSFDNGWMNPYYVGINYYLNLDQFSPYLYGRIGFGIGKLEVAVLGKDKYDAKGFYANIGGGFKYYIDKTWGLNCEVGFAYQTASIDEEIENHGSKIDFKEDETLSGVGLGVGFFVYF